MFWFILGLVVFVAWTTCIIFDEFYDWGEKIAISFLILIASMIGSVVAFLIATCTIGSFAEVDYKMVSTTKIIALKDNQNVSGSFYVMGGYVDEDLYYYYAAETEFGYKTEKIVANNTYIRYTDGEARIEEYKAEFVNDDVGFFAAHNYSNRYVIYCPEGTVTNEFDVDLE